jgi:periplasmic protein CpxP/Spy
VAALKNQTNKLMKVSKPMIVAALVAGNLLAWNVALRAADTNTPPARPAAGAPPPGQRPPGFRGGFNLDQLSQQLNLTDDQKTKVKPILEARDKKLAELHGETGLSRDEIRTKAQAIRAEITEQMKAVLTAEQFEKWQKLVAPRTRPGPPPDGANSGDAKAPAPPPKN